MKSLRRWKNISLILANSPQLGRKWIQKVWRDLFQQNNRALSSLTCDVSFVLKTALRGNNDWKEFKKNKLQTVWGNKSNRHFKSLKKTFRQKCNNKTQDLRTRIKTSIWHECSGRWFVSHLGAKCFWWDECIPLISSSLPRTNTILSAGFKVLCLNGPILHMNSASWQNCF